MKLSTTIELAFHEYRNVRNLRSLQKAVRLFDAACAEWQRSTPELLTCRIWIASNYSTQFVTAALKVALAIRGIDAEIDEVGYNQWEPALLNPQHPIFATKPDLILLLLSPIELAFRGNAAPEAIAERIATAIHAAKRHGNARIVVTLPEPLGEEYSKCSWAYDWRWRVSTALQACLQPTDAILVDLEPLIRMVGGKHWFSARYYVSAKLPFHPDHTHVFANYLANVVRGVVSCPCKLIITDLDNTLWGGVVGEVGWENVDLDAGAKGHSYLRFQRFLKHLQEQGVLLAIASRNEPDAALEVFRRRPEMIIREEDVVAKEINWNRKSENILRILQRLNLSTSGVIFMDDSPVEREEVRTAITDVIVPDLPSDPADWVPTLLQSGLFEGIALTPESVRRKPYYEEERIRQVELESSANHETFLRKLEIRLRPEEIANAKDRVVELINKTNQFNLTTRRYGWSRIEEILTRGGLGFCFRLEDRFGDYGLISVMILSVVDKRSYRIDTWVMSCRAMGRTVEQAILAYMLEELAKRGASRLVGEYIPSGRNAPVASLYASLGFGKEWTEGTSVFSELKVAAGMAEQVNRYVTIVAPPAAGNSDLIYVQHDQQ